MGMCGIVEGEVVLEFNMFIRYKMKASPWIYYSLPMYYLIVILYLSFNSQ